MLVSGREILDISNGTDKTLFQHDKCNINSTIKLTVLPHLTYQHLQDIKL